MIYLLIYDIVVKTKGRNINRLNKIILSFLVITTTSIAHNIKVYIKQEQKYNNQNKITTIGI